MLNTERLELRLTDEPAEQPAADTAIVSPEPYYLPEDLIARWGSLPENTVVQGPITKSTLDCLFFAVTHAVQAQIHLGNSFIEISHGRVDQANRLLKETSASQTMSINNMRLFLQSLIETTLAAKDE